MLRTLGQKKTHCATCPIAKTADLIGDTVMLLIIRNLLLSSQRFTDLATSLEGISTRTITNKLKLLTKAGLIAKEKGNDTHYILTPMGTALSALIGDMEKYGKKYL